MGQHIRPFLFEEEHLVRSIERNDGEVWFVLADICRVLGHSNPTVAASRLDPDEQSTLNISEGAGGPDRIIVSEPGVYRLVFTSRKPVAERFKRWLAHDVVPSLRRTGFYAAPEAPQLIDPPPPAEPRMFPDWPMEEMRTKKSVVDMYRLMYGVVAAQWLSPQLGFPTPPREIIEIGRQFTLTLTPTEQ